MTTARDDRRRWISPREAAENILGVHIQTVYVWIAQGRLKSARIGRKVFVDRRQLEEGLEAQIQEKRR